jgi:hypothetical protein
MLQATRIVELHDQANAHWHDPSTPAPDAHEIFSKLVLEQHRANFDLWHREDAARDPMASDQAIAAVKHAIDELNQRRNDLTERLDQALLAAAPAPDEHAPLNSETPGLIIDRLSILSLKLFHTGEETRRPGAGEVHHQRNRERLSILTEQRGDLACCLSELWSEILARRRRFKLYRQLKMYNDPELNPVLYASTGAPSADLLKPKD